MEQLAALRAALDVLQVPSRLHQMRSRSLPAGIPLLLEIAAGDDAALKSGSRAVECTEALAKSAAIFFIEQVLLSDDSDCYRVLGAQPDDTREHLRRNMALLMRWLHPDRANADRATLTRRVSAAWEKLKSEDHRSRYDGARANAVGGAKATALPTKQSSKSQSFRSKREQLLKAGVQARFLKPDGARSGNRRSNFGFLRKLQTLFDKLHK